MRWRCRRVSLPPNRNRLLPISIAPKPAYTRFRLGGGWVGGWGGWGPAVPSPPPPTPTPSPQGGGEEFAAPPRLKLTPMGGIPCQRGNSRITADPLPACLHKSL